MGALTELFHSTLLEISTLLLTKYCNLTDRNYVTILYGEEDAQKMFIYSSGKAQGAVSALREGLRRLTPEAGASSVNQPDKRVLH